MCHFVVDICLTVVMVICGIMLVVTRGVYTFGDLYWSVCMVLGC